VNTIRCFALADIGAAYVESTLSGNVPVVRTPYDEPFPRGWATGTFNLLVVGWGLTALYSRTVVVTVGLHLYESGD
jgi:hypothetical protein